MGKPKEIDHQEEIDKMKKKNDSTGYSKWMKHIVSCSMSPTVR